MFKSRTYIINIYLQRRLLLKARHYTNPVLDPEGETWMDNTNSEVSNATITGESTWCNVEPLHNEYGSTCVYRVSMPHLYMHTREAQRKPFLNSYQFLMKNRTRIVCLRLLNLWRKIPSNSIKKNLHQCAEIVYARKSSKKPYSNEGKRKKKKRKSSRYPFFLSSSTNLSTSSVIFFNKDSGWLNLCHSTTQLGIIFIKFRLRMCCQQNYFWWRIFFLRWSEQKQWCDKYSTP